MAAPEETTDDSAAPEPEDRWDPDLGPERAEAGAARSPRRNRGRLTLAVVFVVLLVVALRGAGVGSDDRSGDSRGDRAGSATTTTPDETSTTAPPPTSAESTPATSVAPPDVAHPRPPVDLAATPDPADAVEVARWWAAVFVAYVGAEPAEDLADRLATFTTSGLQQDLLAMPLAASYDLPVEVVGVSAQTDQSSVGGAAGAAGSLRVLVTVEAPRSLALYRLDLIQDQSGGWRVDEATRL